MSSLKPWRSLAEWERDPQLIARAAQEFPSLAAALAMPQDRRRVLKLMAAAFALGALGGCDEGAPGTRLIPAVRTPAGIVPGRPDYYATAHVADGYATGIVVTHRGGRPIKVEGNPLHPASLGATDVLSQAQVLDFYDPERNAVIGVRRIATTWQSLQAALLQQRTRFQHNRGEGLRILTGTVTSPTLGAQLDALLARYPQARWHRWDPISRERVADGAQLAYGRQLDFIPRPDAADVVFAVDSDLLSSAPGHLRFARDFATRRNPTRTAHMNRLYALESMPTLTGCAADHRYVAAPAELRRIVTALAAALLQDSAPPDTLPPWTRAMAADLRAHPGRVLMHVGPDQPAALHALAHAVNEKLGAPGTTFTLLPPVAYTAGNPGSLPELIAEMRAGRVTALLIVDSNPVYAAPGALDFAAALSRVDFTLALGTASTETGDAALWSVPMVHPWEDWSDARAYDGTATVLQPQALPLYDGISPHVLLAQLLGPDSTTALEQVQLTWRQRFGADFDARWNDALAAGVVSGSAAAPAAAQLRTDAVRQLLGVNAASVPAPAPAVPAPAPLEVLFRPDPYLWDGRYANNAWLQELPRPLTKLTWDNPLLLSPALAHARRLANGDRVRLSIGNISLTGPVWVLPGMASDCIVALRGFGRRHAGEVAAGAGFDVHPLMGRTGAITLEKLPGSVPLASTEHHDLILNVSDRLVRHGTLEQFLQQPAFLGSRAHAPELYRQRPPGPAAWAMSVDLNSCIGCNACTIACQAENNVPVVGKDQVLHEREMHWLRIDRYWEGTPDDPTVYFQPVLCMQCEQAPCETVCPVGATVHDSEGLNVMVYNRCVGTRFCSNNCPYKVRRFNYFDYADREQRAPQARNPEVSVRARGVMEKCTFCLQRIAQARIVADRDNRPVGEVRTACQAACPTQAITFGNQADAASSVARRKLSPLDYALLEEQGTHPRVTYEARIANPDPALQPRRA